MPYKDKNQQKEAQKRSYLRRREQIKERHLDLEVRASRRAGIVQNYRRKAEQAQEAKKRPCADCGHEYPYYVMDFDHVRGEKVASVSALLSNGFSWIKIQEEIDKCDVVCANCHRERTHQRGTNGGTMVSQDRV